MGCGREDMDNVHSFPTFSNGWPPSLNCADPRTDRSPIFSHCRLTFPELPSSMDLEFKTGSQNISKYWVRVILDQILPGCSVNRVFQLCVTLGGRESQNPSTGWRRLFRIRYYRVDCTNVCQQCRRLEKGIRIPIDGCFTIRFQGYHAFSASSF